LLLGFVVGADAVDGIAEEHVGVAIGSDFDQLLHPGGCSVQRRADIDVDLLRCLCEELLCIDAQPMLTDHTHGTLAAIMDDSRAVADAMRAAGYDVTRIKVEVETDNRDVPQTDSHAAKREPQQYFEHHVKLLLPGAADMGPIIETVKPHDAHVSRNALRARDDGREERFVTQRCYRVSKATARGKLDALLATLRDQTFEIIDLEEEYVVFDSNTALDAGWIEPG